MFNTRSKQIIIISVTALLVGFLFTRNIKGLVKSKQEEKQTFSAGQQKQVFELTIEQASARAKNLAGNNFVKEITLLETDYRAAKGGDKTLKGKMLAQKWNDVEQAVPSALYLEVVAQQEPTLKNWLLAGERFLKAFDNTPDTLVQPFALQKANRAFTKALAIDSANIEAKTGLAITIVNGMGAPMQGIAILLEVVKKEPKNLIANMNLGLFAIKSRQFDKAVTRFTDIIKDIKASPEAYFYLGIAYENLRKNQEAIEAFLKSKKMAANPALTAFIDKKVAELKNKN